MGIAGSRTGRVLRIAHHPHDHGVRFRPLGTADMVAERVLRAAEVVPREGLIDDDDSCCCGAVGRREVASGDQGNTKRLQIIVADPGKLDVQVFVRLGRITGNRYIASNVVVLRARHHWWRPRRALPAARPALPVRAVPPARFGWMGSRRIPAPGRR